MNPLRSCLLALAVTGAFSPAIVACGAEHKKLVEFGWDEPDTAFMRKHITEMQQTPFDGCIHVGYQRTNGTKGSFTWDSWGKEAFTEADK